LVMIGSDLVGDVRGGVPWLVDAAGYE
jgi:hypothetical protein